MYLKALRILGEERDEIIATFEAIKDKMYDTTELETEQAALQQEVMVVTELVEQCISENAHVAQNGKIKKCRAKLKGSRQNQKVQGQNQKVQGQNVIVSLWDTT